MTPPTLPFGYTKKLMKHFQHPKFVKKLKNPDAVGEVGNMKCGDVMHLEIKVDKKTNKIKDIGFQTFGCPAELGTMPPIKIHCSLLGIEALNKSIKNYENKIKKEEK
jgi:NifU-like protein involved in Fe-S cluster formation